MNNKKFQFKTNINCGGCVSKVTPVLDNIQGINQWNVDTESSNKLLTVVSDGMIDEQTVVDAIQKTGFKIESFSE